MRILSYYLSKIKRNPASYMILVLAAALAVTARLMAAVLCYFETSFPDILVFSLCPFLSIALFWLPNLSPTRSPLWLYRVVGFGVFIVMGYVRSVYYLMDEPYPSPHALGKWFLIWLRPVIIFLAALLLHRLFSYLASKGWKLFKVYRHFLAAVQPYFRTEKSQKALTVGRKIALCFGCALLTVSAVMLTATVFLRIHFPSMDIEAILFTIEFANDGYTPDMARKLIFYACIAAAAAILLSVRLVRLTRAESVTFIRPDRKPGFRLNAGYARIAVLVAVPVVSATSLFIETSTFSYISNLIHTSTIYEQHYVVPTDDLITFPEEKKNLIYIYLESFENTYTTPENGGLQDIDFMPELTDLANSNISFSNGDKLGGSTVYCSSVGYTMGATIAQTSGVVLMTPLGRMRNKMGELNCFLPSLRRLEDILHDNGYTQLFIEGSDSNFAAYNSYVGRYEDSSVFDLNSAIDEGLLPEHYFEMWGFEDCKMFAYSKQKIEKLAGSGKPFAVTMYTMDTHSFEEGYRCELCGNRFGNRFANSVSCTSRQVKDFIDWLKTKPYYDDTVIIITGDHIAEHVPEGLELEQEGYVRTPYNCFINAAKQPADSKNRQFSPMDMFPTTLSALGAEIKGDRLGLGTDLFSSAPTLCEELGTEELTSQVQLKSDYFNREFWKEAETPQN
ncbi:MAG: sulfatase-like hydrolase/transferase [Ruminococcus sp.]|nr:sulfatase-like hydrolase/transferase [Ruminococcus sp.]